MYNIIDYIIDDTKITKKDNYVTIISSTSQTKVVKCFKSYEEVTKIAGANVAIIKISKSFWLNFANLTSINFSHNFLIKISKSLFTLKNLRELVLDYNSITFIPSSVLKLSKLETFSIAHNKIKLIPNALIKTNSIKHLNISYNEIQTLPIEIGLMTNLIVLHLEGNLITELPTTLCHLKNLIEIQFDWFDLIQSNVNYKSDSKLIYKSTVKLFEDLLKNSQLYCDMFTFITTFNKSFAQPDNLLNFAYISIENVYPGVVTALLKINPSIFNKYNDLHNKKTPFYNAISSGDCENITDILLRSMQLESLTNKEIMAYLSKGIKVKNLRLIESLTNLKTKNSSDFITESGLTPFHYLFASFHSEIGKTILIAEKFYKILDYKTINYINKENWAAIHVAARRGSKDCFNWICETNSKNPNKKFLINLKGKDNWTPLHLTSNTGNIYLTNLLLLNGADPLAKTVTNKTPRKVANENFKISKLLLYFENKRMHDKYKITEQETPNDPSEKNKKKMLYTQSRANINFYKEIFLNRNSSVFEISEAIYNLTFTMIKPLGKKVSIEEYENFVEKTLQELELNCIRNYLIICGLSSLSISLNAKGIIGVYDKILKTNKKIVFSIKNEMKRCVQVLLATNKHLSLPKPTPPSKKNKKKINIISLRNYSSSKKESFENCNDSLGEVNIMVSHNSGNVSDISGDFSYTTKIDMFNTGVPFKGMKQGTNITNESCNIQDSSLSIIKVDNIGNVKLKGINK